jgi:hypothetical protein
MGVPELDDMQAVLEAALRYSMEGLENHVRQVLVDPRFGQKEPMGVFAIACRYKEVHIAAKYSTSPDFAEILCARAGAHIGWTVTEYCKKYSEAARAVTAGSNWIKDTDFAWFQCICPNSSRHPCTCVL